MQIERFRQVLAAYGTDPRRWPAAERGAALELVATDQAARRMLDEEGWLNDLLDAYDPIAPPDMTQLAVPLPRQLPPQRRGLRALLGGFAEPREGMGGRALWPQLATLTMASLVGAVIGWNDPTDSFADPVEHEPLILLTDASYGEEWIP